MDAELKEIRIIMTGELEAAERLCEHLRAQEVMIRENRSKDVVASMREATELAEILHHYEAQRARWTETHSEDMPQQQDSDSKDTSDDRANIATKLKSALKEVQDRTLINATLLGRMVDRGREMLQEIAAACSTMKSVNPNGEAQTPAIFLDQRI
jgi:hypothetical protein